MFIIGVYAPMGISLLYNFVILRAVVRSMLARVTPTRPARLSLKHDRTTYRFTV